MAHSAVSKATTDFDRDGRAAAFPTDRSQAWPRLETQDRERLLDACMALGHDIRGPLNAAGLQARLAEAVLDGSRPGADAPDEVRESLAAIRVHVDSASELLGDLLEITRSGACDRRDEPAGFDLNALLARTAEGLRPQAAERGIAIEATAPTGLSVRTRRRPLERILSNLAGNAVKHTRDGTVRLEARVTGHDVALSVTDTGPGIPAEHLSRIFDAYYRAGDAGAGAPDGVGLGLWIARELAQSLGGNLTVASRLGVGSRFCLRLPGIIY